MSKLPPCLTELTWHVTCLFLKSVKSVSLKFFKISQKISRFHKRFQQWTTRFQVCCRPSTDIQTDVILHWSYIHTKLCERPRTCTYVHASISQYWVMSQRKTPSGTLTDSRLMHVSILQEQELWKPKMA